MLIKTRSVTLFSRLIVCMNFHFSPAQVFAQSRVSFSPPFPIYTDYFYLSAPHNNHTRRADTPECGILSVFSRVLQSLGVYVGASQPTAQNVCERALLIS